MIAKCLLNKELRLNLVVIVSKVGKISPSIDVIPTLYGFVGEILGFLGFYFYHTESYRVLEFTKLLGSSGLAGKIFLDSGIFLAGEGGSGGIT